MTNHEHVHLFEVGPRDGLQAEDIPFPTSRKLELISCLISAGLREIQVASFVHPGRVPQMADAERIIQDLPRVPGVTFSALVLNRTGLERAVQTGIECIEVSVSASTTHSKNNTGMSREQALAQGLEMIDRAKGQGFRVRASVQCSFGCVFEGEVPAETVWSMGRELVSAGADSLALADTTGMGHPRLITRIVGEMVRRVPHTPLSLHLHDTQGLGLVNMYAALECGIRRFDTSCGGLGGCPFVPGAAGNIATEDTVSLLHKLGYATGVDWTRVAGCTQLLEEYLGRRLPAKMRRESVRPLTCGSAKSGA